MLTRFVRSAALAIPFCAMIGCASLSQPTTYGLDPGGAALVRQTCSDIMGLPAAIAEFDACGDSLAETVRALNHTALIARASEQCEQQGYERGTPDLATCVVLAKRAEGSRASVSQVPTLSAPATRHADHRSDTINMSGLGQHERAELSCAHLGLHPASLDFRQCVLSLQNAIFAARNPM